MPIAIVGAMLVCNILVMVDSIMGGYWDNAVSQCLFGEVASFESKTVGYFSIAFFYLAAGLLVVDILSMYFSYMRAAGKNATVILLSSWFLGGVSLVALEGYISPTLMGALLDEIVVRDPKPPLLDANVNKNLMLVLFFVCILVILASHIVSVVKLFKSKDYRFVWLYKLIAIVISVIIVPIIFKFVYFILSVAGIVK